MTLPGMPLAIGDPGVFVCSIPDGGAPPEGSRPYVPTESARPGVWLVLALCPHCMPRTGRYCSDHGAGNWWLTSGHGLGRHLGGRKGNAPPLNP